MMKIATERVLRLINRVVIAIIAGGGAIIGSDCSIIGSAPLIIDAVCFIIGSAPLIIGSDCFIIDV